MCIPQNNNKITIEDDDTSTQEELNPKTSRNKFDESITVKFASSDNHINFYSIACKKSDQFNEVVNKLFKKFPQYKNKKIFFLCNANVVDENKTISENGIKNDNAIVVTENVL